MNRNIVLCNSSIEGCHCERSEAISIVGRYEIATAFEKGLAMTTPQIKCYRAVVLAS
jgi:hypothetical protein